MRDMQMTEEEIDSVLTLVAAILHLGNINFDQDDREKGFITDQRNVDFPAYLLGFDSTEMHNKLLTHKMETNWGGKTEITHLEHSKIKATVIYS